MAARPQAFCRTEEAVSKARASMAKPLLRVRLPDWPSQDQAAWARARATSSSPFAPQTAEGSRSTRKGSGPSEATFSIHEKSFGTFVAFLRRQGLDAGLSAVPHVIPTVLDAWVADQKGRGNRETTIMKRLEALQAALRMIAPGRDFRFLVRPGGRPLSRLFSRQPRRAETVDSQEIISQIKALHAEARAGGHRYGKGRTVLRDAALLALLACRGPRIGEVCALELGRTLLWRNERWEMRVEAQDNKNDRPRDISLADWVQPILTDYIRLARPELGGHASAALWLSTQKRRCPISTLTGIVVRWTRRWFGQGRGPHWMRKCLTTTVANERPDLLPDVAVILDHSTTVALQHYNLAQSLVAGRRHSARLERLVEATAKQGRAVLDAQRIKRRPLTWKDQHRQSTPLPGVAQEPEA